MDTARKTLKITTQHGVQTLLHPSTSRCFSTNDHMLCYNRINTPLFCDTMSLSVRSTRGNSCGQVFSNEAGWSRFFPLQSKSEAHLALSTLFKNDGVPNDLILDGSKEQTAGDFKRKCREADVHILAVNEFD